MATRPDGLDRLDSPQPESSERLGVPVDVALFADDPLDWSASAEEPPPVLETEPVDVGSALVDADGEGMFLPSPLLFDPGDRVRLALRLRTDAAALVVTGEVTRVETDDAEGGPGMRFAFRDLDESDRASLSDWLAKAA